MLESRAPVRRMGETNRTLGCTNDHPVYPLDTEDAVILYIYAIRSNDSASPEARLSARTRLHIPQRSPHILEGCTRIAAKGSAILGLPVGMTR